MKHTIIKIICAAVFAVVSSASAQTLSIASVQANVNAQTELVVSATGLSGITALQFNLSLPTGVTTDEANITKGSSAANHTLVVRNLANGSKLFVLYNTSNAAISDGTLLRIPVTMPADAATLTGGATTFRTATTAAVSSAGTAGDFTITVKNPITLTDNADNSTIISNNTDKEADVTLSGRTIKAGSYNTFAVPFRVTSEQMTAALGSGWKAKRLTGSTLEGETLTMQFGDVTSIRAGRAYLLKVAADVVDPIFEGVTVSSDTYDYTSTYVDHIATLGSTTIGSAGDDASSIIFLGAGNKLYNPTAMPAQMKGFRGYFHVHDAGANARRFSIKIDDEDDEITGVQEFESSSVQESASYYDLQGRKVSGQLPKGIYIVNGKKVIVK